MGFDLQKAAAILGSGGGALDAIGVSFGMPTCLLNMSKSILGLLPSSALGSIADSIQAGKDAANNITRNLAESFMNNNGMISFDTETGKFTFKSDSSKLGMESDEGGLLSDLGAIVGGAAAMVSFGGQLYNNYEVGKQQLEDLHACVKNFKDHQAAESGLGSLAATLGNEAGYADAGNILAGGYCTQNPANLITESACILAGGTWIESNPADPGNGTGGGDPTADALGQYAIEEARLQNALNFANKCLEQLRVIGEIFRERQLDPTLEPCFAIAGGGSCSISQYNNKEDCEDNGGMWEEYEGGVPALIFSGTDLCALTQQQYKELYVDKISLPPQAIFDLVYGPPVSKEGQFILTIDGLYYDSQTGGVPDVIGFVPPAEFYKFEQPANLGGKGTPISNANLNLFVSSIFDPDKVDNSRSIQIYHDHDHFLQVLKGQRDKHINMLNKELETYQIDGSSLAITQNKKEEIYSQAVLHESKIDRRKKQIEIAVKASSLFGASSIFAPGNIPINDFSYLKNLNIIPTLEQQKGVVFEQADVADVVLPLHPKFVMAKESEGSFIAPHLLVPTVGKGAIVYDASTLKMSTSTSSTATLYSLSDEIVTKNLFAVYNFLNSYVESPSSTRYAVMNCAFDNNIVGNAQLLGEDASSIFTSGLAIPRLKGLVKYRSDGNVRGLGSAVRLPDTNEYKDFLYNPSGATFETWVHMPGFMASSNSNVEPSGEWGGKTMSRILLGCENIGGTYGNANINTITNRAGLGSYIKGFLAGFTRDQQLTSDSPASNTISNTENSLATKGFFVAPTQSYNGSGVGFINKTLSVDCKEDSLAYYKFFIPADRVVSGVSFNDVSSQFMHICTTISPSANEINVYLDGVKMGTSSLTNVFGVRNGIPALPSFFDGISFEYNSQTIKDINFIGMDNIKLVEGPSLNQVFTPWILGGGYTDGILKDKLDNGFMGPYHGQKSGLNGFVGSVKFYSRDLNTKEVLKNYKAQKGFFKNIKT